MAAPDFRDQSMLRVISIGVAAENKLRDSDQVEVVISEQLTFLNGELKSDTKTDIAKGVDSLGNAFEVSVTMSNTVLATWLGDGTNRATSPDVRRGDRLEILQYGEVDKFYWRAQPIPGKSVRKLETVVQSYSNTRNEADNTQNAKNSWYSEVNTHEKVWTTVQTNKNDGEPYAYTQQFDAKKGNVVVAADDAGNYIQVNSADTLIEFENAMNSFVRIDKDTIRIGAKKVIIDAGSEFTLNTPNGKFNVDNGAVKGSMFDVNVANTTWKGNVAFNGAISVEGGGGFTVSSGSKFTGSITHMGVNIGSTHRHYVYGINSDTNIVSAG